MFDRMKFKGRIDFVHEAPAIISKYHLEECTKGEEVYYQSSPLSKLDGLHIMIRGATIEVSCSIHKLWSKSQGRGLDNSGSCTVTEAQNTIRELIDGLGIDSSTIRVPYYEIGISMKMSAEAIDYIRQVTVVGEDKEMFIDANYERDRQKTTAKSKYYRKIMKIYDKTFEARDRRRKAEDNILRVETIYRHQGTHYWELFQPEFIEGQITKFMRDWSTLTFQRIVKAKKGVKASMVQKAKDVMQYGLEECQRRNQADYKAGIISQKTYRGYREFLRDWKTLKECFVIEPSAYEIEYQNRLQNAYNFNKN